MDTPTCTCGHLRDHHHQRPGGGRGAECPFCSCMDYVQRLEPPRPTPPAGGPHVSACRTCRAPIIWAITQRGARMPVDAAPVPGGNVVLEHRKDGTVLARTQGELGGAAVRHVSHFATCPGATHHRRR